MHIFIILGGNYRLGIAPRIAFLNGAWREIRLQTSKHRGNIIMKKKSLDLFIRRMWTAL